MDIIIASEDAQFSDPVVAFGVNGIEYFLHAWELGPRKAKELLFTGGAFSAAECHQLGMVNHVVKREELEGFTLEFARRIASRSAIGFGTREAGGQLQHGPGGSTAGPDGRASDAPRRSRPRAVRARVPVDPAGIAVIRNEAKAAMPANS